VSERISIWLLEDALVLLDTWIKQHPWVSTREEALGVIVEGALSKEMKGQLRDQDRPVVCFSGQGLKPRSSYLADAETKGWQTRGSVTKDLDVLVIGDDHSARKVAQGQKIGARILTYDEWETVKNTGDLSL